MISKTFVILLALLAFAAHVPAQSDNLVWQNDYKEARRLAMEAGRPLLIDFTTERCKQCIETDNEFWRRKDVIAAIKHFVPVKVNFNVDKTTAGKYSVGSLPFLVVADPFGNVITYRRDYTKKDGDDLKQIFAGVPSDFAPVKKQYAVLELKKDDGNALLEVADYYRKMKMLRLSNEFYERAMKTPEIKADADKTERAVASHALNDYTLTDFKASGEQFDEYLKNYPSGKYRELIIASAAIGSVKLEKPKMVEKYTAMLKAEFPQSKNHQVIAAVVESSKNK